MKCDLAGIIVPVLTPFDEAERYSPGAMRDVIDYLIERGVHAALRSRQRQ